MNFEKLPEPPPGPRRRAPRGPAWLTGAGLLAAGGVALALIGWLQRIGREPVGAPAQASATPPEPGLPEAVPPAPSGWAMAAEAEDRAIRHLRRREIYQAQAWIGRAWSAAEAAARHAPGSPEDEARRLRLAFLNRRHAELGAIQDLAYDRLRRGADGVVLEVTADDELFRRLAGPAAGLEEADEFRQRLGWVLGCAAPPAGEPAGNSIRVRLGDLVGGN